MLLKLSGNYLRCTYTDENGRVVYKVQTKSTGPGGKTKISKILPYDIPRRPRFQLLQGRLNSHSDDDGILNDGDSSGLQDRFAHLGRIDWKSRYSVLVRGGEEFSTKDSFRRDGLSGKLGRNRVFTGDDGREYKWLMGTWTSELQLNDGSETPIAKLDRGNVVGIFGEKRPAVLEIYPAGEDMVDLIMLTFLYVEKMRREG